MAKYNIHSGHNFKVPGANGYFSETKENREVKNKVIFLLRELGHTVYDCTDEDATTTSQNLINIVNKCNENYVDLDVSIHFNAFNGEAYGVEVYQYDNQTDDISKRICAKISSLGFKNRGVKDGSSLYVLRKTNSKSILIECCFCDNYEDLLLYDTDKMAEAIVEGILNIKIPDKNNSTDLYRVRKTWYDASSQIGAFKSLDNAISACINGYTVYDSNGNAIYSNSKPTINTDSNCNLYRVRKSWNDVKSQLGAYKELDNAKNNCPFGYSVYDNNGNEIYKNTNDENNDSETDYISPLKGISRESFIEYIGTFAKENMKETGVLASVVIAQAILESSWGQSELSLKANNLFGMKTSLSGNTWHSNWDGRYIEKESNEVINGKIESVLSTFRLYSYPKDSIIDHSNYLIGAKNGESLRYKGLIGETDYKKAIQIIKNGGYATDDKYVDKIISIIEEYNLDVWDSSSGPSELEEIKLQIVNTNNLLKSILEILQNIMKFFTNK